MIVLNIKITGIPDVIDRLDERHKQARENVQNTLDWFGKGSADEMVRTHTFQNRTYRLEGSIGHSVEPFENGQAFASVFALTSYASLVEFGVPGKSRPYPFFWPVFYKWLPLLRDVELVNAWQAGWKGEAYTPTGAPSEDGAA